MQVTAKKKRRLAYPNPRHGDVWIYTKVSGLYVFYNMYSIFFLQSICLKLSVRIIFLFFIYRWWRIENQGKPRHTKLFLTGSITKKKYRHEIWNSWKSPSWYVFQNWILPCEFTIYDLKLERKVRTIFERSIIENKLQQLLVVLWLHGKDQK